MNIADYLMGDFVGSSIILSLIFIIMCIIIIHRYRTTPGKVPKSLYLASVSGLVTGILYFISGIMYQRLVKLKYDTNNLSFLRVASLMSVSTGTKYGKIFLCLYLWTLSSWSATNKDNVLQVWGIVLFITSVICLCGDLVLSTRETFTNDVSKFLFKVYPTENSLNKIADKDSRLFQLRVNNMKTVKNPTYKHLEEDINNIVGPQIGKITVKDPKDLGDVYKNYIKINLIKSVHEATKANVEPILNKIQNDNEKMITRVYTSDS